MKALLYKPDGTLVKSMEVHGKCLTLYTMAPLEEEASLSLWDEVENLPRPTVQTFIPTVQTFILEWSNGQFALYVEGDNT